ncbi:AraC family transcriptional regulator [Ferrimonas aestuarii]|uniref:AraC family transcriptional regulator n=2 Tax=Ferrimonas aestuarii TaxID=2569539 RepID=A0A4U1BU08_9GAMM|nr:AraC family transcriptional regulator [Ferrimonas aestuarii]
MRPFSLINSAFHSYVVCKTSARLVASSYRIHSLWSWMAQRNIDSGLQRHYAPNIEGCLARMDPAYENQEYSGEAEAGSVIGSCTKAILALLADLGWNRDQLVARFTLNADDYQLPESRTSYRKWRRIIHFICDNPAIYEAISKMGNLLHLTSLHGVGYAMFAAPTPKRSIQYLVQFQKVVDDLTVVRFEQDSDFGYLVIDTPGYDRCPVRNTQLMLYVIMVLHILRLCAGVQFSPCELRLPDAQMASGAGYLQLFGCPIQPGDRRAVMAFSRSQLIMPLPGSNPALAQWNAEVAQEYLVKQGVTSVVSRVRAGMVSQIQQANLDQYQLALTLGLSVRQLQRQLQQAGTSYTELLNEVRAFSAKEMLRQNRLSLGEISYRLGFANSGNFCRAFKRWCGVTPFEFRGERVTSL